MGDLRAGLIGLGVMGSHHARILSSLPGVELVGIVDPYKEGQLEGGLRVPTVEALLDQGVDYCLVAVPTSLHAVIGQILAQAGVHALIEKPLASDSDSAKKLVECYETAGLIGGVGHVERYNPALNEARERIKKGQLGRIFQITTRRQGPFPSRVQDVGVVKDLATHDIDLTMWIVGEPYVSVSSRTGRLKGRENEDLVSILGLLRDGTLVSHSVNWTSPYKVRTIEILGEQGAFVIDTLTSDLTYHSNGAFASEWEEIAAHRGVCEGEIVRYAFPKPEPLRREHEAFRDALLGKQSSIISLREGLETLRVAEAVLLSAGSSGTSESLRL